MKNHSETHEQAKSFVLYYDIEDNNIIVHFADGKSDTIPYTIENEKNILTTLKQQIENYDDLINIYKLKIKNNIGDFYLFLLFTIIWIIMTQLIYIPYIIFTLFIGSISIQHLVSLIKYKTKLNDIFKSRDFLNNEALINNSLKSIDDNILKNTSKKTKEIISNENQITLNTIHKMKYMELKKIIENIKYSTHTYKYEYFEEQLNELKRYSKK